MTPVRLGWVTLAVSLPLSVLGCEPVAMRLAPPPDPEKVAFVASGEVVRVAVGWNDLCLQMSDGSVRCKQDFRPYGERRLGSFFAVAATKDVVELAAGHHHACARSKDGLVACWGRNDSGEVGGDDLFVRTAQPVGLPGPASEVRVGDTQSCARLASGPLWCWGNVGQAKHAPPTELGWFAKSAGFALGPESICAFDTQGLLQCSLAGAMRVSPLPAGTVVKQVALGRLRGCALASDGTVHCFSLARPKDAAPAPWSSPVPELSDVERLATGGAHACALRKDGSVYCWGENRYGQLGDGTRTDAPSPVRVKLLAGMTEVFAGGDRSCAMGAGRDIVCWGADLQGDAMFRALTGLSAEQGPPGPQDSLVPEPLRVPTFTGTPAAVGPRAP
jgi:hypothetical protein